MPKLTIDAIHENPWNAVTHTIPPWPSRLLLEQAQLAAAYCRDREYLLMMAVRERRYVPPEWQPIDGETDAHELNEANWLIAEYRVDEITAVLSMVAKMHWLR